MPDRKLLDSAGVFNNHQGKERKDSMPGSHSYPNIAIDGPAGSGKSTVAREVSRRLNLKYLDTGAMYRAITLKFLRENIDLSDLSAVEEILDSTSIELPGNHEIIMDGERVTEAIRTTPVNRSVSPVSAISAVRRRLVDMQRQIAAGAGGIVMEGRDIASMVLPDADYKFYLDATPEERARRRGKEQELKGIFMSGEEVLAEIVSRDNIDSRREDSPLRVVPGALVIDTTGMSIEEVVEKIIDKVNRRST